eukprot:EST46070.1 Kinesin-7 [Spironucleus salmonicida]
MTQQTTTVLLRLRPLVKQEKEYAWTIDDNIIQLLPTKQQTQQQQSQFQFQTIYDQTIANSFMYEQQLQQIASQVYDGLNCTLLAYGQSSAGKTHTMFGNQQDRGIIQLVLQDIFEKVNNTPFKVKIQFIELYNENLVDLLSTTKKIPVIREDQGNIVLQNVEEPKVTSVEQCLTLISQGQARRTTSDTNLNETSSRSHAIIRLVLEQADIPLIPNQKRKTFKINKSSVLTLVDLAGSEKQIKTNAQGQRLKEANAINQSLLTLGIVINALANNQQFIPYRDSKLTRLLQNSLGGNALSYIIGCISPDFTHIDESINTMRFLSRATKVINKAKINEFYTEAEKLEKAISQNKQLKLKIKDLESQIGIFSESMANLSNLSINNDSIINSSQKLSLCEGSYLSLDNLSEPPNKVSFGAQENITEQEIQSLQILITQLKLEKEEIQQQQDLKTLDEILLVSEELQKDFDQKYFYEKQRFNEVTIQMNEIQKQLDIYTKIQKEDRQTWVQIDQISLFIQTSKIELDNIENLIDQAVNTSVINIYNGISFNEQCDISSINLSQRSQINQTSNISSQIVDYIPEQEVTHQCDFQGQAFISCKNMDLQTSISNNLQDVSILCIKQLSIQDKSLQTIQSNIQHAETQKTQLNYQDNQTLHINEEVSQISNNIQTTKQSIASQLDPQLQTTMRSTQCLLSSPIRKIESNNLIFSPIAQNTSNTLPTIKKLDLFKQIFNNQDDTIDIDLAKTIQPHNKQDKTFIQDSAINKTQLCAIDLSETQSILKTTTNNQYQQQEKKIGHSIIDKSNGMQTEKNQTTNKEQQYKLSLQSQYCQISSEEQKNVEIQAQISVCSHQTSYVNNLAYNSADQQCEKNYQEVSVQSLCQNTSQIMQCEQINASLACQTSIMIQTTEQELQAIQQNSFSCQIECKYIDQIVQSELSNIDKGIYTQLNICSNNFFQQTDTLEFQDTNTQSDSSPFLLTQEIQTVPQRFDCVTCKSLLSQINEYQNIQQMIVTKTQIEKSQLEMLNQQLQQSCNTLSEQSQSSLNKIFILEENANQYKISIQTLQQEVDSLQQENSNISCNIQTEVDNMNRSIQAFEQLLQSVSDDSESQVQQNDKIVQESSQDLLQVPHQLANTENYESKYNELQEKFDRLMQQSKEKIQLIYEQAKLREEKLIAKAKEQVTDLQKYKEVVLKLQNRQVISQRLKMQQMQITLPKLETE